MDEIIDAIIAKTEKSLSALESTMYRSVLDHYIDNLKVDASGKIAFNTDSISAVSTLDKVLKKLDAKLADFTNTTLSGVNTIVDKSASNLEKYNTENVDFKTANKERILKHAETNVNANASLSKPLSDLKQRTLQLLSRPGGVSLSELRDMLKKESLDKGVATKQFSKWTQDLFYQYERASSNAMRKTLGFRFAIYQGGLIETSRPFCSSKNGKVFHEEEIEAWAKDDFAGKTDPYDPYTDLGGHRCRHRLGWVSDEVAFALRPELEAKYGKKVEPKKIDKLSDKEIAELEKQFSVSHVYRGQQKGLDQEQTQGKWFSESREFSESFANSIRNKKKEADGEILEYEIVGKVFEFPYKVTEYARITDKLADIFGVKLADIKNALDPSLKNAEALRIHALLEDKGFQKLMSDQGYDYINAREGLTARPDSPLVSTYMKINNKTQEQLVLERLKQDYKVDNEVKAYKDVKYIREEFNKSQQNEYLKVAGVPEDFVGGATVRSFQDDKILVSIKSDLIEMYRVIDPKSRTIVNEEFKIPKSSSYKGQGANIFKSQVDEAISNGFKKITTSAVRSDKEGYNGYYTWARLGYRPDKSDAALLVKQLNSKAGTSFSDWDEVVGTRVGLAAWKEHGVTFPGEFDLTPGSKSLETLNNYINSKR